MDSVGGKRGNIPQLFSKYFIALNYTVPILHKPF
jgi:hypothetical protein